MYFSKQRNGESSTNVSGGMSLSNWVDHVGIEFDCFLCSLVKKDFISSVFLIEYLFVKLLNILNTNNSTFEYWRSSIVLPSLPTMKTEGNNCSTYTCWFRIWVYCISFANLLKLIKICIKHWLSFCLINEFAQRYYKGFTNFSNLIWLFLWLSMITIFKRFLSIFSSPDTTDSVIFEMFVVSDDSFISFYFILFMISMMLSYLASGDVSLALSW